MNSERIKDCTILSAEVLKNFELSELPIGSILLKCLRLCRFLGDDTGIQLFQYETSGYPTDEHGKWSSVAWTIAEIAGRVTLSEGVKQGDTQLLSEIESLIESNRIRLKSAFDPNINISSANPNQTVFTPLGNSTERRNILERIRELENTKARVSGRLYDYIVKVYYKLAYNNILEDTFTRARLKANEQLVLICPSAVQKFVAVYENMDSSNPEDWANAVHSCRRILLDLADSLFPPREEPIIVEGKHIKVGRDQYINRLIQFINAHSGSDSYKRIVGSDLASIGDRLDSIYNASNKGSHSEVTKEEASRYIIHTYLLISDILTLSSEG